MNSFAHRARWKWYLAGGALLVVLASVSYSTYLTEQLAGRERERVADYLHVLDQLNAPLDEACVDCASADAALSFYLDYLQRNTTIPILLTNQYGFLVPGGAINFPSEDSLYLVRQLAELKTTQPDPLVIDGQRVYFRESTLLRQIRYFPWLQLLLVAVFFGIAYYAFATARRAEENLIWVGMSKETAHQLGTPTSAIVGWVEHLRAIRPADEEVLEVADELQNDVQRLELIANRFSKIGAVPELQAVDLYTKLEANRAYMQRRAPRKVEFRFPDPAAHDPLPVYINPPLFDWVVENLLRNALDAMGRKGQISADVYADADYVYLDLSDTGHGISPANVKRVFKPGFSTKKRGWGLGLSLARRIIHEYHSGKLFVKKSVEGAGTTFTIQLPREV